MLQRNGFKIQNGIVQVTGTMRIDNETLLRPRLAFQRIFSRKDMCSKEYAAARAVVSIKRPTAAAMTSSLLCELR